MKSGIRSIGEIAYATLAPASTFAYQGVRASRAAEYSAIDSRSRARNDSASNPLSQLANPARLAKTRARQAKAIRIRLMVASSEGERRS